MRKEDKIKYIKAVTAITAKSLCRDNEISSSNLFTNKLSNKALNKLIENLDAQIESARKTRESHMTITKERAFDERLEVQALENSAKKFLDTHFVKDGNSELDFEVLSLCSNVAELRNEIDALDSRLSDFEDSGEDNKEFDVKAIINSVEAIEFSLENINNEIDFVDTIVDNTNYLVKDVKEYLNK